MNGIKAVLLLCTVSVLGGCANYSKFVKNKLKIPYVYIPPNNLDHPYTLVQSTPDGNFQTACSASLLTGIKKEDMAKQLQFNDTSTFGITDTASATFDVKVEKAELGTLNPKYTRINKVQLALNNGKLVTLPDVSLSEVVKNIAATHCKDDVSILFKESPNSTFFIPMQLYAYDIQYHIYTEDGVDVTAELPKEVTQIVLVKAGLGYKSATDITMSGSNLYVGFRGTPINATLASMLENQGRFSSMVVFNVMLPDLKAKMREKEKIIDVTSLVKDIAAEKN